VTDAPAPRRSRSGPARASTVRPHPKSPTSARARSPASLRAGRDTAVRSLYHPYPGDALAAIHPQSVAVIQHVAKPAHPLMAIVERRDDGCVTSCPSSPQPPKHRDQLHPRVGTGSSSVERLRGRRPNLNNPSSRFQYLVARSGLLMLGLLL